MAAQAARAQAKAPPAAAPRAAVMQRAVEPVQTDVPRPLLSLATIPAAAPAVQRMCSACEAEDKEEMPVQPQLEVGPVGDRYEQEADAIAGQVMAMRDGEVSSLSAGVQRACSACSDEQPRARRRAEVEDEVDRLVRPSRDGGSETIAASDSQLTSGGSPLPAGTRGFFEERMSRDLGDVRVHQGGGAHALNESISARAFTYKNHVWLAANENVSPSFTLAHELAHVMQQTAPGPIGPRRRSAASTGAAKVQRVKCNWNDGDLFFAPRNKEEEAAAEKTYLSSLTGNDVLGEVPIPNATKYGGGGCKAIGKAGYADLVKTSNGKVVGFGLKSEDKPLIPRPWYTVDPATIGCDGASGRLTPSTPWPWFKRDRMLIVDKKPKFPTLADDAAPFWSSTGRSFTGVGPTSIEIGEVKFGGTPGAREEARDQIGNYLAGIKLSHAAYDSMRKAIEGGSNELEAGTKPALPEWNLTAEPLTGLGSPGWTVQKDDVELVIARWAKALLPRADGRESEPRRCDGTSFYKGKFYGGQDSAKPFVRLYAWYPDSLPPANAPDGSAEYTGFKMTAERLMQLATASPAEGPQRRMRTSAVRRPARRRVQRKPKPGKPVPTKDPFVEQYAKWKEDRATLAKQFGAFEKTDRYGAAIEPLLFNTALANTKDITSKAPNSKVLPDTSPTMKAAQKGLRNLRILASPAGLVLGALRMHFGQFFLSVMKFFTGVKDKFEELFKKPASGSSSGMAGKALHVFTKILGAVASYMLPQITDALLDCAKEGIRRTVEGWLENTPLADLEKKLNEYMVQAETLRDTVMGEVTTFVETTFGPLIATYESIKDKIKVVVDIVGIAKKAFNAARALACLAGGLETAGIACVVSAADALLGLVGLSPTELLLASLLGTCAAQEVFGDAILGVQKVRELPRTIAGEIVSAIRDKLPESFKPLICEQDFFKSMSADMPKVGEVTCQEDTVPQGGSWRIPSGVDPKLLNRKLKKGEKSLGGFDPEAAAAEIPPKEPESPPPSSPAEETPDSDSSSGDTKSGGGDGATGGMAPNMSIEKGKLDKSTGTAIVTWYVHGIGRGFDIGKYAVPESRNVQISFSMDGKFYSGTDVMAVKVLEVIPPEEGDKRYIIHFVPQDDYLLKTAVSDLEVPKGELRKGYLGARR